MCSCSGVGDRLSEWGRQQPGRETIAVVARVVQPLVLMWCFKRGTRRVIGGRISPSAREAGVVYKTVTFGAWSMGLAGVAQAYTNHLYRRPPLTSPPSQLHLNKVQVSWQCACVCTAILIDLGDIYHKPPGTCLSVRTQIGMAINTCMLSWPSLHHGL